MRSDRVQVLPALAGRRGIADGGLRQCDVEMIFRLFEVPVRGPQQKLCSQRGLDGRRIVANKEARLQLAGPIEEFDTRQIRVSGQTALDPSLIKLRIVKAAKCRCKSPEGPDH